MKTNKILASLMSVCMFLGFVSAPCNNKKAEAVNITAPLIYEINVSDSIAENWSVYEEVIELVNKNRAENGAAPLKLYYKLCQAAEVRAGEITENFSHIRPDGSKCFTVLDEYSINRYGAAENIAAGYYTADDVVEGWMNSSGHRANILNTDYTHMGIGLVKYNGMIYWSQIFTKGSYSDENEMPQTTTTTTTTTELQTTITTTTAITEPQTTTTTYDEIPQVTTYDFSEFDSENWSMYEDAVNIVNENRKANGSAALNLYPDMCKLAEIRANELIESFSHTRPDGSRGLLIIEEYGIISRGSAENIASGYDTANEVVEGWMNSSEHRQNILDSAFTHMGIGVAEYEGTYYWVQLFADTEYLYGDANCDSEINLADSVIILQSLSNPDKYGINGTSSNHMTRQGEKNADCSGSENGITTMDALAIQKFILKLITLPEAD